MQLSRTQKLRLQFKLLWLNLERGWSWDHVRRVTFTVAINPDTNMVRIILANASLLWAFFVLISPATFERPAFAIMRTVAGWEVWALCFFLHFLGVYWRTYDPIARSIPSLIINSFGFFIWFFTTVSLNFYVGALSPATSAELSLCGASAWALYKTGFKPELISP